MIKKTISILMMILLVVTVSAIKNPSAVYCEEMGYEFSVNVVEEGDVGMCKLPDGKSVEAWDFLKGKVGEEYSYCEQQGYVLKIIKDNEKCSSIFSQECAVCVVEIKEESKVTGSVILDSDEVEVTTLMNLSFNEATCGDGVCVTLEENHGSCPDDCSSGLEDYYCDKVEEGICDPDCTQGEDPDCPYVIESEPEIKCVYDGICLEECIGTDDIDCICFDPESEECQTKIKGEKEEDKSLFSKIIPDYRNYLIFGLIIFFVILVFIVIHFMKEKKKEIVSQIDS